MPTNIKMVLEIVLPLVLLAGCPSNPSEHAGDAGWADADLTSDAKAPGTVTPVVALIPLGAACSSNTDCSSGFCTDGVCCDSACGQTCYACDQQAALGHCGALTSGEDPSATVACVAPSACFLPPTLRVPACRFVDGTACQADGDCVSGHCLTYYVDADGDGYGTAQEAHFCEELSAPRPVGYAAYSGDCCDIDSGANPG